ncbi:MAG TPA: HD domain-containing phosphohydrolase [Verrucomicrobiae bacterium]|nr:HD domain-containing phosphohydrolase [Verrucomicrobiae bacterium]
MHRRILCVDDETNVLNALQRNLRKYFAVDTATDGAQALTLLDGREPYAVIVADMRMPGMDGVEFLTRARAKAPDSIRIMLTGNADQQTAVDAVNRGHVYQFLTKPCPPETLAIVVSDGVKQYEMLIAERELLEKTLNGSVKVLTEILSVIDPQSFGRGQQLRESMRLYIVPPTERAWELELAALLAPIGCVSIPAPVLVKARARLPLSDAELTLWMRVPEFGSRLIANIPRLETVAKIILYQNKHFDGSGFPVDKCAGADIPVGARILKVLNDLLDLESKGVSQKQALEEMQNRTGWYDPRVLDTACLRFDKGQSVTGTIACVPRAVSAAELREGQVITQNVYTADGMLIVKAGSVVTPMLLDRLTNFAAVNGLREPIEVQT